MTKKTLEELERRISEHFYNEAELMVSLLEANLSAQDWEKLKTFMKEHPFHKAYVYLKNVQSKNVVSKD